jgi:hypothetical protein
MPYGPNRATSSKEFSRFPKFTNLIKDLKLLISWAKWWVWLLSGARESNSTGIQLSRIMLYPPFRGGQDHLISPQDHDNSPPAFE